MYSCNPDDSITLQNPIATSTVDELVPQNAIDEDNSSFFQTEPGIGEFWGAKFANGQHYVTRVVITNRGDENADKLASSRVLIDG